MNLSSIARPICGLTYKTPLIASRTAYNNSAAGDVLSKQAAAPARNQTIV
jgi:hypothetical protein